MATFVHSGVIGARNQPQPGGSSSLAQAIQWLAQQKLQEQARADAGARSDRQFDESMNLRRDALSYQQRSDEEALKRALEAEEFERRELAERAKYGARGLQQELNALTPDLQRLLGHTNRYQQDLRRLRNEGRGDTDPLVVERQGLIEKAQSQIEKLTQQANRIAVAYNAEYGLGTVVNVSPSGELKISKPFIPFATRSQDSQQLAMPQSDAGKDPRQYLPQGGQEQAPAPAPWLQQSFLPGWLQNGPTPPPPAITQQQENHLPAAGKAQVSVPSGAIPRAYRSVREAGGEAADAVNVAARPAAWLADSLYRWGWSGEPVQPVEDYYSPREKTTLERLMNALPGPTGAPPPMSLPRPDLAPRIGNFLPRAKAQAAGDPIGQSYLPSMHEPQWLP